MNDQHVDADVAKLREDVAQLRADLSRLADSLQKMARARGAEFAGQARDSVDKLQETLKSKTADFAHEIEEKPITSALTSFAIGVVLGAIFGTRRS